MLWLFVALSMLAGLLTYEPLRYFPLTAVWRKPAFLEIVAQLMFPVPSPISALEALRVTLSTLGRFCLFLFYLFDLFVVYRRFVVLSEVKLLCHRSPNC